MVNIGIHQEHIDYMVEKDTLLDCPEIKLHFVSEDNLPEINYLILEMILGSYPEDIINHYLGKTTIIVWQSGVWSRTIDRHKYRWLRAADWFRGYDRWIECFARKMGKQIWRFPQLIYEDLGTIVSGFSAECKSHRCLYPANIYHSAKLGYSSLYASELEDFIYTIPYNHLWQEEDIINIKLDNVVYTEFVPRDEFLQVLGDNAYALFQITERVAWGQCIRDAVCVGIPSISNTFYQRIFYPDLYCGSLEEGLKMLSWDYDRFEPFVNKAQQMLRYLVSNHAKNDFVKYLLSGGKDGLPRLDCWEDKRGIWQS